MSGSKQTSEDPETHIEIQITNKQATSTMLTTIKPNTSELCVHIYIYIYIYIIQIPIRCCPSSRTGRSSSRCSASSSPRWRSRWR